MRRIIKDSSGGTLPYRSEERGKTVLFGSYPQSEVTDPSLKAELDGQAIGDGGEVTYGGERYRKSGNRRQT